MCHIITRLGSALLACFTTCAAPAFAQDSILRVSYTEEPFSIDGDPGEWDDSYLVHEYLQQNPIKTDANSASIHLAWDEANFYLMASVFDHRVYTPEDSAQRLHLNDALEMYLDPLHDSGARMDANDYQFIVRADGKSAILKGDLTRIYDTSRSAPKEFGIATLVYSAASRVWDGGYSVEMAVPFAGIGLQARKGSRMRMDFCMNDLDTLVNIHALPMGVEIPRFFFSNWSHEHDFSFPERWKTLELQGHPDPVTRLSRKYARNWLFLLLAVVLVATALLSWMAFRIRQLKHVPEKKQVPQWERAVGKPGPATSRSSGTHPPKAATTPPASLGFAEDHSAIAKSRSFILAHLDEEIGPEALADHCALSLRQLQRIFKDNLAITPGNLVAIIKMEQAAVMLASGKHNVNETAHALGYQDGSYFSRVFRKYHGHPPPQLGGLKKP